MSTVDDGAFDLDAALVLVRVDPRRGCAELHRLLAGEAAAYARSLGVQDVADHLDEVFGRAFQGVATFAGHGRDFRLSVLGLTSEVAEERLGAVRGTELGVAVLLGVLGCSTADAATVTGTSLGFVEANRPASATSRYHRRRFPLDQPPQPGPNLRRHLDPRSRHLPTNDASGSTAVPAPRRHVSGRRVAAAAVALLLGVAVTAALVGRTEGSVDTETVSTAATDVIVSNPQPTPPPAQEPAPRSPTVGDPASTRPTPDPVRAIETDPTAWSYDVRTAGRATGTIDDAGHLAATVVPSPGWTVEVDEDTPPWLQATFTDGAHTIRFLAIADGPAVRVWVFDLGRSGDDDELAAPPAVTPTPQRPRPTPTPSPTPGESPPPRPQPTPPEGGGDLAAPTPQPTPTPPRVEPTPDESPTPDEGPTPDASPSPDESPTPDEPDPDPTPDDPDDEESGNSGPGGGGPDPDPDRSGQGSGSSGGATGGDEE